MMSSSAYHRPFNGSSTTNSHIKSSNERVGRTLSDLLRSRDKLILGTKQKIDNDDNVDVVADYDQQHEEIGQLTSQIISTLNVLVASGVKLMAGNKTSSVSVYSKSPSQV